MHRPLYSILFHYHPHHMDYRSTDLFSAAEHFGGHQINTRNCNSVYTYTSWQSRAYFMKFMMVTAVQGRIYFIHLLHVAFGV